MYKLVVGTVVLISCFTLDFSLANTSTQNKFQPSQLLRAIEERAGLTKNTLEDRPIIAAIVTVARSNFGVPDYSGDTTLYIHVLDNDVACEILDQGKAIEFQTLLIEATLFYKHDSLKAYLLGEFTEPIGDIYYLATNNRGFQTASSIINVPVSAPVVATFRVPSGRKLSLVTIDTDGQSFRSATSISCDQ